MHAIPERLKVCSRQGAI